MPGASRVTLLACWYASAIIKSLAQGRRQGKVELSVLQWRVASALDAPPGRLLMMVKPAHNYLTERDAMAAILAA
jgi:hypothetical protein